MARRKIKPQNDRRLLIVAGVSIVLLLAFFIWITV